MIEQHLNPDYSKERTCPNCGLINAEVMIDVDGNEGCDECMAQCDLYDTIHKKADMSKVIVRKLKGWCRGRICSEALVDEDYKGDWKDDLFEVYADKFNPNN